MYSDHRDPDYDSFTKASLLARMSHVVQSSAKINRPRELQHVLRPFLGMASLSKAFVAVHFKTPGYVQNNSPNSVTAGSIAPRTTLGRSNLIHLRNALFELFILAFLVRMPLILSTRSTQNRNSCNMPHIPHISKAGSILRSDSD